MSDNYRITRTVAVAVVMVFATLTSGITYCSTEVLRVRQECIAAGGAPLECKEAVKL